MVAWNFPILTLTPQNTVYLLTITAVSARSENLYRNCGFHCADFSLPDDVFLFFLSARTLLSDIAGGFNVISEGLVTKVQSAFTMCSPASISDNFDDGVEVVCELHRHWGYSDALPRTAKTQHRAHVKRTKRQTRASRQRLTHKLIARQRRERYEF